MSIKREYISDLTGEVIIGKPKVINLQRSVQKPYSPFYGSSRTYASTETKAFHVAASEVDLLPDTIKNWLFPVKAEKKSKKKVAA